MNSKFGWVLCQFRNKEIDNVTETTIISSLAFPTVPPWQPCAALSQRNDRKQNKQQRACAAVESLVRRSLNRPQTNFLLPEIKWCEVTFFHRAVRAGRTRLTGARSPRSRRKFFQVGSGLTSGVPPLNLAALAVPRVENTRSKFVSAELRNI